jgi:RNA polymerase sigma factor (TIGR02999 family)
MRSGKGCKLVCMTRDDVTRMLHRAEEGDVEAASQLLPLVYDELRKLAAHRLSQEKSGQTLQPTALVHEAYIRLVDVERVQHWDSRGHFFAAAAEAMRRILVDNARRKKRVKHGGLRKRIDLDDAAQVGDESPSMCDHLLELDDALERLAREDPQSAELVKLRYFAGLTIPQAAQVLGVSPRKADLIWSFARVWLQRELEGNKK